MSQFDTPRLSAEKLDVKEALESPQLLTERRLLDAKPFSGARDVPLFRNNNKVAQVT